MREGTDSTSTPERRFWQSSWFVTAVVIIVLGLTGLIATVEGGEWGRVFGAELLAALAVGVGIGVVVTLRHRWAEERARESKAKDALLSELRQLRKVLAKADETGFASADYPLRTVTWRAVASGPLLDAVPAEWLDDVFDVYSRIEEVNIMAQRWLDLYYGPSTLSREEVNTLRRQHSKALLCRLTEVIARIGEG